jgi:cystathionine beta-lyase/cystathionine gamma-synthase
MKKKEINSSRTPLYRDSGFELYNASATSEAFLAETGHERDPDYYIYSRYRNPTVVSAEEAVMKIEGCNWALLTQSGMSAIDTALSVFQFGNETGPWLFFSEIYGGTISYIETVLKKRRGLDIRYFAPSGEKYDLCEFEKLLSDINPSFVYLESVSNPMLIVADIAEVIRISEKHGSKVIIDNTFATPYLCRPLDEGADIVIHSATKYFSGHGNLTAGIICGNDPGIMKSAIEYRKFVGHMLSPDDAYRLQSQMLTFELRFRQQCSNACQLAGYLEKSNAAGRVWYPGLKSHSTHLIADRLFGTKGFGAMITFDFDGKDPDQKRARRDRFIELVSDQIKLIPTLGDPHTILMPVEAVWGAKYPEPGMLRLSVGFEDYNGLEKVISDALEFVASM